MKACQNPKRDLERPLHHKCVARALAPRRSLGQQHHTAAMLPDLIKRLSLPTYCKTKRLDRLQYLIDLYAFYHNESLNAVARLICT